VLIDWSHPDVPATLVRAGYVVVGHGPGGYTRHDVVAEPPSDKAGGRAFLLADSTYLVGRRVFALPEAVDIVNTYRPAEEQPAIAREAVDLGARALWVQPGVADTVRRLGIVKDPLSPP
jgi:hypothetical protein